MLMEGYEGYSYFWDLKYTFRNLVFNPKINEVIGTLPTIGRFSGDQGMSSEDVMIVLHDH